MVTGLALALVVLLAVALLAFATAPFRPVARGRVEAFARKQLLTITPGNGNLVIRYLVTTRRWRGCGLLLGFVVTALVSWWQDTGVRISALGLFAGWFAGAVIAEWRVHAGRHPAAVRAASLAPRRARGYLRGYVRRCAPVSFAVVLAIEVSAAIMAAPRRDALALCAWVAATLAIGGGVLVVTRHVLHRPQPVAEPDVVAADDAVRARSLQVLAGSGTALAGYLLAGAMNAAARDHLWWGEGWPSALAAVGAIVLPLFGVVTATAPAVAPRLLRTASLAE